MRQAKETLKSGEKKGKGATLESTKQSALHGHLARDAQPNFFQMVAAKPLRAKPALASHVPEICKYVDHWVGEGNPPKCLTSLAEYLKTVKKVFGDNLTQEALRKVNALDFGFGKGGHVRMWVLEAILGRSNINAAGFFRSSPLRTARRCLRKVRRT